MGSKALALIALIAGCVEPDLIPCGAVVCVQGPQVCNEDDPDHPVCEPPHNCGDRITGYREQCDGDNLAGQTCTSQGFYAGALGCTSTCELDLAGCSGRCGDGIVQASEGELCDGPFGGSCFDRGFDDGVLGCSACQPTTPPCGRYGWRRLVALDTPIALAAAGGYLAVIDSVGAGPPRARLLREDQPTALPAPDSSYSALASVLGAQGPVGSLLFVGRARIDRWDSSTAQWTTVPLPPYGAFAARPLDAYATEVGGVLEIWVFLEIEVAHFQAGTWTSVSAPVFGSGRFAPAARALPPVMFDTTIAQWNPTAGTFESRQCIGESNSEFVAVDRQDRLWQHSGSFIQVCKPTDLSFYGVASTQSASVLIAPGDLDTMVVLSDGAYRRLYSAEVNLATGTQGAIPAPSNATFLVTDGARPYIAIPGDAIRTLTTGGWGGSVPPTRAIGRRISALHTDEVVAIIGQALPATSALFARLDGSWRDEAPDVLDVRTSLGGGFSRLTLDLTGQLFEDGFLASIDDPLATFTAIWTRGSATSAELDAAAVGPGVFARREFGVWLTEPLGFSLRQLLGSEVGDLHAIATDTWLYRYDGTAWSRAIDLGVVPTAAWRSPSGTTWVVAANQIIRVQLQATTPLDVTKFPGSTLLSIDGLSDTEIIVGGAVDDDASFSGLLRYNGQLWYEVRAPEYVGRIEGVAIARTAVYALTSDRDDPTRVRVLSWMRTP